MMQRRPGLRLLPGWLLPTWWLALKIERMCLRVTGQSLQQNLGEHILLLFSVLICILLGPIIVFPTFQSHFGRTVVTLQANLVIFLSLPPWQGSLMRTLKLSLVSFLFVFIENIIRHIFQVILRSIWEIRTRPWSSMTKWRTLRGPVKSRTMDL